MSRIEIHIITYNEQIMLPFTIAHYTKMFDNPKIIVHDNNSTDDTQSIAELMKCVVIPFSTDGMNDTVHRQIKSEAARNCTADWVLCIDCDEECLVNSQDLIALENRGVNIVKFEGWDIFDSVLTPWDITTPMGCRSPGYYKPVLLRPGCFKNIEFGAGAHDLLSLIPNDGTEVVWSNEEYKLLHYKHWSSEWNIKRSAELAARQSTENKQRGHSTHFAFSREMHQKWFDDHDRSKEIIIDKLLD